MLLFPDVRRDWLFFGEGEPFADTQSPVQALPPTTLAPAMAEGVQAIPLVGFASCSQTGWYGKMTIPVAVTMPHGRPDMIAVMASGESMIPAGIGHGHVCFCDPHILPMPGECVYVEQRDETATLKQFLGRAEVGGNPGIRLQGWHDAEGNAPQKTFFIDVADIFIVKIAPVVYIQRRM